MNIAWTSGRGVRHGQVHRWGGGVWGGVPGMGVGRAWGMGVWGYRVVGNEANWASIDRIEANWASIDRIEAILTVLRPY